MVRERGLRTAEDHLYVIGYPRGRVVSSALAALIDRPDHGHGERTATRTTTTSVATNVVTAIRTA